MRMSVFSKGLLVLLLVCVAEAASVASTINNAKAMTINNQNMLTESQALVALSQDRTVGINIPTKILHDKAVSMSNDIQSKIDMANYVWFGSFVTAFVASLASLPAIEHMSIRGAVGWSFWSIFIAGCSYIVIMSVEFIALHRFVKRVVVWIANFVLAATGSIEEAAERVANRTNIDVFALADRLPPKAVDMILGNHLSFAQQTKIQEAFSNIDRPSSERDLSQDSKQGVNVLVSSAAEASSSSSAGAIEISDGLVNALTSVPWESFPVQTENICEFAWLNTPTTTISSNFQVFYSNEGPLEVWSPIARWNMRRRPSQKTIPNPSNCTRTSSGAVNSTTCPGYLLWTMGASSYCDCAAMMSKLGYEQEITTMASCVTNARDTVMRLFRSVLVTDASMGKSRNADLFAAERQTSCLGTFDVLDAAVTGSDNFPTNYDVNTAGCIRSTSVVATYSNRTVPDCVALCEASSTCLGFDYTVASTTCVLQNKATATATCASGMVAYLKPVSVKLMYRGSNFSDAASLSDYYARLGGTSGLQWVLSGCLTQQLTFDVRYSAVSPVRIQVLLNQQNTTLADDTNVLAATGGSNVLMRGNFVVGPVDVTAGSQTIQFSRLFASDAGLVIHRVKICADGTEAGCPTGPVDTLYCYRSFASSAFSTPLTNFGAAAGVSSFPMAVALCNARSDCAGLSVSGSNYILMGGSRVTGSATVYQRSIGVADSFMCL